MKLLSIIVVGYTRMSTNGFKSISITPESDFLLVLGSNGSGKSSLMDIISPLPPSKALFETDGGLTKEYEHKGSHYKLISGGTSWRHEFYKDHGENLNPGGTATVQTELVRQYFGVDKEIMDLFCNKTKFSTMAPSIGRRHWIAKLNPNDLTFAMDCFKHYSKRFKEARDVSRYLDNRITTETSKQLDLSDTRLMEEEMDLIRSEIQFILSEMGSGGGDEVYFVNTLDETKARLGNISNNIIKTVKTIKGFMQHAVIGNLPSKELSDIEIAISERKQQLATEEGLFNHFRREYTDLDNLSDFLHTDIKDIGELEEKLQQLEEELDIGKRSIRVFHLEGEMEHVIQDSENCLEHLVDILNDLPANPDRELNPDMLKRKSQGLSECRYQIDSLDNRIANVDKRLETIQHAKEEQCPKCKYIWIEGVGEHDVEQCKQQKSILEAQKLKYEEQLGPLEEEVNKISEYVSVIRQYKNITVNYPRLQPLWDVIAQKGLLFNEPNRIWSLIKDWNNDIRIARTCHAIAQEIKILKETLNFSQRMGEQGGWELGERKDTLQQNMERAMVNIDRLNDDLLCLSDLLKYLRSLRDLVEEKNHNLSVIKETLPRLLDAIRGNGLKEVLQKHYNRITELQSSLNEKLTLEKIIEDLTRSYRDVCFDKEVFGVISAVLSPSDGLIADSLMGIIHTVVENMNLILKQLWNTPLSIKPCQNKNGELDYVFPICVGNLQTGTENDVDSSGSSSQEDVINLAYKLVVYHLLDLQDFPLFIDELGRSFDDLHRVNLMNYIKQLGDSKYFSQIFMINHFQSQYGSFNNAEVIVINDSNIVVPSVYNKNVIFG